MNPVNQKGKCTGAWTHMTGAGWADRTIYGFWRWLLVGLVTVLFFGGVNTGTAVAFETEELWNYGIAKVGMMHSTGDLDEADYDPGFAAGLSYGRYLTEHFIIEGGFDFFSSMDEREGYNNDIGGYDQDNYFSATGLIVTFKGEFPAGPIRFYIGGGIGAYYVLLNSEIDADRHREFDEEGDDAVWGMHLVTGGYYNISPRLFMGFEGMYRWTEEVRIDETRHSVPITYEGDLDGYQLVFTTGFRF